MKFRTWGVLPCALLSLVACSSPEPVRDAEPEPEPTEEEVALEEAKPGMVMFRAKKAPLRAEILPKFLEQAGVKIHWTGSERYVTIRMIQPMEWREALELVCQFTRTHATTDYQGRLVLKDGYGGTLVSDDALLEEEQKRQARIARSNRGASGGSSGGGSGTYRETTTNSRGSRNSGGVKYNKGRDPTKIFDSVHRVH